MIGQRVDDVLRNGTIVKKIVPVHAQFIPMRQVLQKVFSMPGVYAYCGEKKLNISEEKKFFQSSYILMTSKFVIR